MNTVIKKIVWIRSVLNSHADNEDEKDKNKTGANISLYTEICQNHATYTSISYYSSDTCIVYVRNGVRQQLHIGINAVQISS